MTPTVSVAYSVFTLGHSTMSTGVGCVSVYFDSLVAAGDVSVVSLVSLFDAIKSVVRNSKSEMIESFAEYARSIGDSSRSSIEWKLRISLFVSLEHSLHAINSLSDEALSSSIRLDGISYIFSQIVMFCNSGSEESRTGEVLLMDIPGIPDILDRMP